jgi:hypothetical protein
MEAIIQFHKPGWIEQALPVMAMQSNTMSPGNEEASIASARNPDSSLVVHTKAFGSSWPGPP